MEVVRVVSEVVFKFERDGMISEGFVSYVVVIIVVGDDEGQVWEGSSFVVGNVGIVVVEVFGWVEDGRCENVSFVVCVQILILVGLGVRVVIFIVQSSFIKVNEVVVLFIVLSQFID